MSYLPAVVSGSTFEHNLLVVVSSTNVNGAASQSGVAATL